MATTTTSAPHIRSLFLASDVYLDTFIWDTNYEKMPIIRGEHVDEYTTHLFNGINENGKIVMKYLSSGTSLPHNIWQIMIDKFISDVMD
jgi:phenylacetate-coenzyme A ligase PaaK-like adenylate-forming protein